MNPPLPVTPEPNQPSLKFGAPLRVATVEDHPEQLNVTLSLLESQPQRFTTVGAFADAESALEHLPVLQPDVVLMDIALPGKSGIDCVRILSPILPKTEFMMLTVVDDQERIFQSIRAGATGYLIKREVPNSLLSSIEELHQGGSPMSPSIARKVLKAFAALQTVREASAKLSPRELQVLEGLARGLYYKEIQEELGISFDTVRKHTNNIYRKLQVNSRAEAVAKYRGQSG